MEKSTPMCLIMALCSRVMESRKERVLERGPCGRKKVLRVQE